MPSDSRVESARIGSNGPTAQPLVPPKMFENGPKSAQSPEPHEPRQLSTASIVSDGSSLSVQKLLSRVAFGRQVIVVDVPAVEAVQRARSAGGLAPERRGIDGEVILEPLPVVRQRHRVGWPRPAQFWPQRERALDLGLDQAGLEGVRAVGLQNRLEGTVAGGIARGRHFGDDRSLRLHPDDEEVVLEQHAMPTVTLRAFEPPLEVRIVHRELEGRKTRLLRRDEAGPAKAPVPDARAGDREALAVGLQEERRVRPAWSSPLQPEMLSVPLNEKFRPCRSLSWSPSKLRHLVTLTVSPAQAKYGMFVFCGSVGSASGYRWSSSHPQPCPPRQTGRSSPRAA